MIAPKLATYGFCKVNGFWQEWSNTLLLLNLYFSLKLKMQMGMLVASISLLCKMFHGRLTITRESTVELKLQINACNRF